jgi:Domain of unknown function (DUF4419)
MNAVTSTTFEVSNVRPATEPLPEVSYKEAVEAQIPPAKPLNNLGANDRKQHPSQPQDLPAAPAVRSVESCSRYHGRLLDQVAYHPVVAAVHLAFMDHRPLCLSPDTIWLMIIQGVANHINANAKKLQRRIISHRGKIAIEVRRDDFVKGSPENPWAEVFNEFSMQIRDHIGPKIDLFVPGFSTTGPVERAAAEVVLLDAMQCYFEYEVHTLCGIPTITLAGTPKDWKTLTERVQAFRKLGLRSWLDVVSPILEQFSRAAQGHVDQTFWRSIYKLNDRSGGPVITGWITAFFPYLKDYRTKHATVPVNEFFKIGRGNLDAMLNPDHERNRQWACGPTTEQFPSGLSKAPFIWKYFDRHFDMEFLGGFVGVAQDEETLTLRPEIGWAVREAPVTG